MKKLLLTTILSVMCSSAFAADDVVVDLKAVACPEQTHPNVSFTTKGIYLLNVWNNSGVPQPISIVYYHCVDGGGCMQGQDTHVVDPHSLWSHEWRTELPNCRYGIGTYSITAFMDVRVDSIGQHFTSTSANFISST